MECIPTTRMMNAYLQTKKSMFVFSKYLTLFLKSLFILLLRYLYINDIRINLKRLIRLFNVYYYTGI